MEIENNNIINVDEYIIEIKDSISKKEEEILLFMIQNEISLERLIQLKLEKVNKIENLKEFLAVEEKDPFALLREFESWKKIKEEQKRAVEKEDWMKLTQQMLTDVVKFNERKTSLLQMLTLSNIPYEISLCESIYERLWKVCSYKLNVIEGSLRKLLEDQMIRLGSDEAISKLYTSLFDAIETLHQHQLRIHNAMNCLLEDAFQYNESKCTLCIEMGSSSEWYAIFNALQKWVIDIENNRKDIKKLSDKRTEVYNFLCQKVVDQFFSSLWNVQSILPSSLSIQDTSNLSFQLLFENSSISSSSSSSSLSSSFNLLSLESILMNIIVKMINEFVQYLMEDSKILENLLWHSILHHVIERFFPTYPPPPPHQNHLINVTESNFLSDGIEMFQRILEKSRSKITLEHLPELVKLLRRYKASRLIDVVRKSIAEKFPENSCISGSDVFPIPSSYIRKDGSWLLLVQSCASTILDESPLAFDRCHVSICAQQLMGLIGKLNYFSPTNSLIDDYAEVIPMVIQLYVTLVPNKIDRSPTLSLLFHNDATYFIHYFALLLLLVQSRMQQNAYNDLCAIVGSQIALLQKAADFYASYWLSLHQTELEQDLILDVAAEGVDFLNNAKRLRYSLSKEFAVTRQLCNITISQKLNKQLLEWVISSCISLLFSMTDISQVCSLNAQKALKLFTEWNEADDVVLFTSCSVRQRLSDLIYLLDVKMVILVDDVISKRLTSFTTDEMNHWICALYEDSPLRQQQLSKLIKFK